MAEDERMIACRRLENHIAEYQTHVVKAAISEERMTAAIAKTTENVDKLYDATAGPVKSWSFLMTIRKVVIWCSGFTGLGAALYWLKTH